MATPSDIYAALMNAGFSPHTAANLTAVWGHETGGAYDLTQWGTDRQGNLLNYANANGLLPDGVDAQAGHAYQEFLAMGLDPQNTSIDQIARTWRLDGAYFQAL